MMLIGVSSLGECILRRSPEFPGARKILTVNTRGHDSRLSPPARPFLDVKLPVFGLAPDDRHLSFSVLSFGFADCWRAAQPLAPLGNFRPLPPAPRPFPPLFPFPLLSFSLLPFSLSLPLSFPLPFLLWLPLPRNLTFAWPLVFQFHTTPIPHFPIFPLSQAFPPAFASSCLFLTRVFSNPLPPSP